MIWYCDSSALVKRYVRETGSTWLRHQLGQHELITSTLVLAEVASALTRRWREGTISEIEFYRDRTQFLRHVRARSYGLLAAPLDLIEQATLLIYRAPLSALDAIHLSTALRYQKGLGQQADFYFVTADDQLERAARGEGLQTENPNAHG